MTGRRFRGCAIIWDSNIKYKITKVTCKSIRLCAIDVKLCDNVNMLICNVYMPCDERYARNNFEIYQDTLNEVSQIIHNLDPTYFVIADDLIQI